MAASAFHRAVEALERAHRLALILLVGPSDRAPEAREQLDKLLPPHLHARSYRIDRQGPDLLSFAESLKDPFPILFVHGFERLPPEQREDIELRLNLLRDALAQHHLGLIFWLPRDTLESFLQHCPDLFAWRSVLDEVDGSELFVPPIVAARREYLSRLLRQIQLPEVLVDIQVAADRASLPTAFQEWAMKTRRGLLVGNAGSGKTTALRTLAHRLADHAYDDATQPVPVLLHGEAFSPSVRFDIDPIWPRGVNLELSPDVLSALAAAGRLILLVDGLDEVPSPVRAPLLSWILDLSNRYPLLRMIMATRTPDLNLRLALLPDWQIAHMQKLTDEQARELAHRILTFRSTDPARPKDNFLPEEHSVFSHPLFEQALLSNLGSVHPRPDGKRRLALDRAQFLSDLVERRLKDFDEATSRYRGIGYARRADVVGHRDLRRTLQQIALTAMRAGTTWISRDTLLYYLPMPGLFSNKTLLENAEYLLVSRSGLLQEETGNFSFVHMTIQEYLAAECLEDLGPNHFLELHLADQRWSEVVAYAAALREMRYSTGRVLLEGLALRALRIAEPGPRAVAFATLLGAALGVDVWSDTLAAVLQAARLMIEDSSDATYALEPVVAEAMRLHGKIH